MTVKCLTDLQKEIAIRMYESEQQIKDIAAYLDTSERTVGRVLVEAGLSTPTQRVSEEASHVMKLLAKYKVNPKELESILRAYAGAVSGASALSALPKRVQTAALFLPPQVFANESAAH